MDDFGEKVPKIKVWILLRLFFLSTVIKEQRLKIGLKFMQKFVFKSQIMSMNHRNCPVSVV